LKWLVQADSSAVCTYRFYWEGTVAGVRRTGCGRGTNVLAKSNDAWKIIHEHLSS
jgi:ketosteroid isomerase-like protein